MGVASPLQSGKPVEYWLGGLKAAELVQLWEFLSRNLDDGANMYHDRYFISVGDLPTDEEVRKHLYSESMPSPIYACKDRGGLRPSEPHKGAMGVGLYKHRRARDPLNK